MTFDAVLTEAVTRVAPDLMVLWLGQVHEGDCVELMDRMPAQFIDLIVMSPPYNLKNSTGNGLKDGGGGKWPRAALLDGYRSHSDDSRATPISSGNATVWPPCFASCATTGRSSTTTSGAFKQG